MTVARFWREQKNRYNLLGTKCTNCGRNYFPPREICIDCHRKSIGKMENVKFNGTGKVLSYSIIHDASDTFKILVPYAIAIVELDEGVRITTQIVNAKIDLGNGTDQEKDKIAAGDQQQPQQPQQLQQPNQQQPEETGQNNNNSTKELSIGSRVACVFRKISENGKSGTLHYGYKFKLVD